MRVLIALVSVLAALACTSCLRTTYNHCEGVPDRECAFLDAGVPATDADRDASEDAAPSDADSPDADSPDADSPDAASPDAAPDSGADAG